MSSAEDAKEEGNAAWKRGDHDKAIEVRGLIGRREKTNWAARFDRVVHFPARNKQPHSAYFKIEAIILSH